MHVDTPRYATMVSKRVQQQKRASRESSLMGDVAVYTKIGVLLYIRFIIIIIIHELQASLRIDTQIYLFRCWIEDAADDDGVEIKGSSPYIIPLNNDEALNYIKSIF